MNSARTRWVLFAAAIGASAVMALADVITPRNGPAFRGTVSSIDEKSVTVKTGSETRVMDRGSVRRIEFGDALITGLNGREYINADYRARVLVPEGWSVGTQSGFDLVATKQGFAFLLKGLNFDPKQGDLMKGAIGGMKTAIPDAVFSEPEDTRWAGEKAKKVTVKSSKIEGVLIVPPHSGYMLLILIVGDPGRAAQVPAAAAEWEKQFRFLPE